MGVRSMRTSPPISLTQGSYSIVLRHLAQWAAGFALIALVVACSGSAAGDNRADPTGRESVYGAGEPAFDVIAMRREYNQLAGLAGSARSHLANDCMAEQGFERLPVALPASVPDLGDRSALGAYRLDPDTVSVDGYESTPAMQRAAIVDPRETIQRSIDPAIFDDVWYSAWTGVDPSASPLDSPPPSGCLTEAADALLGPGRIDEVFARLNGLNQLWADIDDSANTDPGFLTAQERWAGCMREAGYEGLESVEAAFQRGNVLLAGDPVGSRSLATADARCQQQSGVIDAYDAAWLRAEVAVTQSPSGQEMLRWHQINFATLIETISTYLGEAGLT